MYQIYAQCFLSELFHSKLPIFSSKLSFEIIFFRTNSSCTKSFPGLFLLPWLVGLHQCYRLTRGSNFPGVGTMVPPPRSFSLAGAQTLPEWSWLPVSGADLGLQATK